MSFVLNVLITVLSSVINFAYFLISSLICGIFTFLGRKDFVAPAGGGGGGGIVDAIPRGGGGGGGTGSGAPLGSTFDLSGGGGGGGRGAPVDITFVFNEARDGGDRGNGNGTPASTGVGCAASTFGCDVRGGGDGSSPDTTFGCNNGGAGGLSETTFGNNNGGAGGPPKTTFGCNNGAAAGVGGAKTSAGGPASGGGGNFMYVSMSFDVFARFDGGIDNETSTDAGGGAD
ncbi:hypothetical protein V6N11_063749 [Hibiscus sabdariffa]